MIWPVLTSCSAASTDAGCTWFAEPRVSAAPHLDGQRCDSVGAFQPCARAGVAVARKIDRTANGNGMRQTAASWMASPARLAHARRFGAHECLTDGLPSGMTKV